MVRLWPHFTKSHNVPSANDRHVLSAITSNLKLQVIVSRSEIDNAYVLAYIGREEYCHDNSERN